MDAFDLHFKKNRDFLSTLFLTQCVQHVTQDDGCLVQFQSHKHNAKMGGERGA